MEIHVKQLENESLEAFERRVARIVTASFDESVQLRITTGGEALVMSRADFISKYPQEAPVARMLNYSGAKYDVCGRFSEVPWLKIERL